MAINKVTRAAVFLKFNRRCAYCGCELTLKSLRIDHIHPRQYGGKDDLDNLNPSCHQCNNYKNVFSLEEFRTQIRLQVERARRYSLNFRLSEMFGLIAVTNKPVVFYFETLATEAGGEQCHTK